MHLDRPRARRADILWRDVDDDLVAYDTRHGVAHSLNATTAFVYRRADGYLSPADIATLMSSTLGVPADVRLVELALDDLAGAGLLDGVDPAAVDIPSDVMSRRQMLLRCGVGAAAIPAITSLVAPTPAMAQSGDFAPSQFS